MKQLVNAAFSRTRVVLTSLVVMIVFGLHAFNTIPREAEPDIKAPWVLVTLPLPGVSPEDSERLLVKPTELELQSVEGVKEMNALAFDSAGQIFLEFESTVDIDKAVADVREAVDRAKAEFPTDAKEPVVKEFNVQAQFPVLSVILYGGAPERTLHDIAQHLQDTIESQDGVLDANLTGARKEVLEVVIDPVRLESYGLNEAEVANAILSNNTLVTAGAIQTGDGRFAVKVPGLIKSPQDAMSIPLRASPDGEGVVTIADVATVRRTFRDATGYALFNGEPSIGINISKRAGANIVETIGRVQAAVEQEAKFWPPSVKHAFINDRSIEVNDNLNGLTSSIVTAVLLVMIVIVAAMGLRSAVMVGVAIPTSFLIGFLLLAVAGFTLNMMVMFALVLSVGMLVDGAIVVIEYADRRMTEGATRLTAYREASRRMFWPITTSTATTLAAFVPFLFWNDMTGEFMKFLPLTLIFVLIASLFVALIFLPVLGSVIGIPDWAKRRFHLKGKTHDAPALTEEEAEDLDPRTLKGPGAAYGRFIAGAIERPGLVLLAAAAVITFCIASFVIAKPDLEYFIRGDNNETMILVEARGNMSAHEKLDMTRAVAARVAAHPSIENIYIQTGPDLGRNTELPSDTIGQVTIDLVPYSQRKHSRLILEDFRKLVRGVPGVKTEVRQREGGPPVGKDVQIELSSPSFEALTAAAKKTRAFIDTATLKVNGQTVPAYMEAEDTLPLPGIEWKMQIDRALAGRFGISVREIGAMIQFVTDGLLIDTYRPDDSKEEIDIRARYPQADRSIFDLDKVRIQTSLGSVPISTFVARTPQTQVDRVLRRDGRRVIDVKANADTAVKGHEVAQNEAIAHARTWLESGALGDGVSWRILGASEDTQAAAEFFSGAMSAALFLIAVILLMEFNNFYHAALTLSAVVLSVVGVLAGVALSGQYISIIMTGTGVVALAGIVVNNNIVLIDTYQYMRKKGFDARGAVIRTAAQRIRPVLLTTATTILGLMPMVFELNFNFAKGVITHGSSTSDWWVLLSSAVVYGLAFSTMLTLILTPVLLAAPTVLRERIVRAFKRQDEPGETDSAKPRPALPHAAE